MFPRMIKRLWQPHYRALDADGPLDNGLATRRYRFPRPFPLGQYPPPIPLIHSRSGVVKLGSAVAKFAPSGSVARHAGWMFVGQGMGYLLRAIYFVLIARLLGVLQYGVVVGALALVGMITNYGRLGSSVVFLRHVSADRTRFAVYWGNILLVTLSMSGLLIVALHLAAGPPHRCRQRRCDRTYGNRQLPL